MTPTSAPAPPAVATASPNNPVAMSQLGTVYATKRRRRNGKSLKPAQKDGVTKSNPSKRHRERLNAELDTLASLLPFEQNILSKLDRLSILRLSVSYLRTKSYFQVVMHKDKEDNPHYRGAYEHLQQHLDGEMFLQALNGFLLILTCDGEVFFATHSIESYLGFHQSDIVHQSVYELVHSEDREELQRQLMWNSFLPAESASLPLHEALAPQHAHLLERSFTVRFRCLLDNTSGFLRLDIRGRVKVLHGQNTKTEEPPLALFALCTPFGPPSLLEVPQKEVMFKSRHKLDFGLVSMDQRGRTLLGYDEAELANLGGYDLVHYDDLAYVASAHQELLKTGASGMIAYRYQTKDGGWQWLQTSSRLQYKNSKPDYITCTHRPLMEEEGRDLLGKRTMDFKVSYLDAGLTNSYFSDSESLSTAGTTTASCMSVQLGSSQTTSTTTPSSQPSAQQSQPPTQRVNRRYKTQLRDFLSTCRSKRASKIAASQQQQQQQLQQQHQQQQLLPLTPATTPSAGSVGVAPVDYLSDSAAAVVAAYGNLNSMYPAAASYPASATADASLAGYGYPHHPQTLYPSTFATTDNLFQYRPLGSYYPEYHGSPAAAGYNGFIDLPPTYENAHQQYAAYAAEPPSLTRAGSRHSLEAASASSNSAGSSPACTSNNNNNNNNNGLLTPKVEDVKTELYRGELPRETVLMWGAPPARTPPRNNGSYSPPTARTQQLDVRSDPLKSLQEMNSLNGDCKWKRVSPTSSPPRKQQQQQQQQQSTPTAVVQQHYPAVTTSQYTVTAYQQPPPPQPQQPQQQQQPDSEVWQGVQHYQYYPYHHHHPTAPRHAPHVNESSYCPESSQSEPSMPSRTPGVLCCPSLR